jgi:alkanesulfonate monooxygenase SsuD/methylene tetrahydromethanopterin reductase-like flavin-dependent oxidoreductase (luciferase family)
MRFITITLIVHAAHPLTGDQKSTQERFREVLDNARLAEELGFDGFAWGSGTSGRSSPPRRSWSSAGSYAIRNSQDGIDGYHPVFAGYLAFQERLGVQPVFGTLEDFVERSSALIGSPAQVIEKVHRYHEQFGWGGGPIGAPDHAVPAPPVAITG